jgi:hypothetical protein
VIAAQLLRRAGRRRVRGSAQVEAEAQVPVELAPVLREHLFAEVQHRARR